MSGLSGYGPSPFNPGTTAANTTVGGWTRGPGVDLGGTAAGNAGGGKARDFANDSGDFALFTVKANAVFELSLSSFDPYKIRRSGTGPTSGQWHYSLDGTTLNNIGSAIAWGTNTSASGNAQGSINLSGIAAQQNVPASTTVSFRIQNFGGAGTGTWYINNLSTPGNDMVLNGLVAAIAAGNNSIITAPATAAFGRVMQGQTPSQNVSLTKTGTDATTYTATPSNNGIGITADRSIAGGNVNELVGVQLMNNANGSASTGVKAYTLTMDNTAADGGADTFRVGLAVVDHATPSFDGFSEAPSLVYDFGSVLQGSLDPNYSFDVFNLEETLGFTAELDFDSFLASGDTTAFLTDFAAAAGSLSIVGGASSALNVAFDTSSLGSYSATYNLSFSDEDLPGALASGLSLTVTGQVVAAAVPEPASWVLLATAACALGHFGRRSRSS